MQSSVAVARVAWGVPWYALLHLLMTIPTANDKWIRTRSCLAEQVDTSTHLPDTSKYSCTCTINTTRVLLRILSVSKKYLVVLS